MAAKSSVRAGDQLRCGKCGYTRTVTAHWLGEIGRHFSSGRSMELRSADLKRFKCSSCGEKYLETTRPTVPAVVANRVENSALRKLAVTVIDQADARERKILLDWANQLIAIRASDLAVLDKAKAATKATIGSSAIVPFVKLLWREIKRLGWDERGLAARLGLGAAAIALLLPGKGAAGIAALGGAIGVPLWIVFGAGGAFAGVIIEEIQKQPQQPHRTPDPKVVEGTVLETRTDRRPNTGQAKPRRRNS